MPKKCDWKIRPRTGTKVQMKEYPTECGVVMKESRLLDKGKALIRWYAGITKGTRTVENVCDLRRLRKGR